MVDWLDNGMVVMLVVARVDSKAVCWAFRLVAW